MKVFFYNMVQFISVELGGILAKHVDGPLHALIVIMTVNYITDIICTVYDKKISFGSIFNGMFHNILIYLLIDIANVIDLYVINEGNIIRISVILFYISNEGLSILDNLEHLGVPIPEKLKEILNLIKSWN